MAAGILGKFSELGLDSFFLPRILIPDISGANHLPSETPVDASQDDFEYESPFARLMSMRHHPTVDGVGLASMTIKDEHRQLAGVVQGGIIVALADYAFHLACRPYVRPGQIAVTVELKTNFLSPAVEGELTATARVVSSGRRIIVCDVDVIGDGETLIARSLGTYIITGQPT